MQNRKVLLIGSGAREHAIAKAFVKGETCELYSCIANRNPGIIRLSKEFIFEEDDYSKIVAFALDKNIDFAFIGPEKHLDNGLTDVLVANGIKVASPSQKAAEIETNKSFMRGFLERNSIKGTIDFKIVKDIADLISYCKIKDWNVVIKPLGLTSGKGVKVFGEHLFTEGEIVRYVKELLTVNSSVLIEEKLIGREFTVQFLSDGNEVIPFPAVRDYKRANDGDTGPNTGSMGSYSENHRLSFIDEDNYRATIEICGKVIKGLKKEGREFKGILYGQFMLTESGIKIIEFNSRFGDPEAINVLSLLKTDFTEICEAIINSSLNRLEVEFENCATVVRYFTPKGYPLNPLAEEKIILNEKKLREYLTDVIYGSCNLITQSDEEIVIATTLSRTFALVTKGDNIEQALDYSLKCSQYIQGDLHYRTDIALIP